jgi:hypothetical protein
LLKVSFGQKKKKSLACAQTLSRPANIFFGKNNFIFFEKVISPGFDLTTTFRQMMVVFFGQSTTKNCLKLQK